MVNDSFYREMTNSQLHAAYKLAKENIEDEFLKAGMLEEVEMMHAIAKERDMVLDDSLSSKIQATKGFIEIAVEKHTRGGKREGAGRKATGTTKKASITLLDDVWEQIEEDKQAKGISQSHLLREIIEDHYMQHVPEKEVTSIKVDQRASMWWELANKNIFEGFVEIKKSSLKACIEHRRYSHHVFDAVWERCVANSAAIGYKKPRVPYLLEAFKFEGERLLFDDNFEDKEERVIFAIMEHVRLSIVKGN